VYESFSKNVAPLLFSIAAIAIGAMLTLVVTGDEPPEDGAPPVADAGTDVFAQAGEVVAFDGTGSTDDAGISTWRWSLEYAGTPVAFEGERALFTFDVPGVYVVTLTVVDGAGASDTDSMTVRVGPA
jgi:PKD repeat protein